MNTDTPGSGIGTTLPIDRKRSALTAAISLLAMGVAAGIAFGAIHGQLVVPGDSAATATNIRNNTALFTVEVALWFIIVAADVIVALALWRFFLPVHEGLSKAAAVVRLIYSAILDAAVVILTTAFFAGDDAFVRVALFERIWSLGLILFGGHLLLLGIVSFQAPEVPRIIAWLLAGAGPAYTVIHVLDNLGPEAAELGTAIGRVLSAPMALAELGFAVWLIVLVLRSRKRTDDASR